MTAPYTIQHGSGKLGAPWFTSMRVWDLECALDVLRDMAANLPVFSWRVLRVEDEVRICEIQPAREGRVS